MTKCFKNSSSDCATVKIRYSKYSQYTRLYLWKRSYRKECFVFAEDSLRPKNHSKWLENKITESPFDLFSRLHYRQSLARKKKQPGRNLVFINRDIDWPSTKWIILQTNPRYMRTIYFFFRNCLKKNSLLSLNHACKIATKK